MLIQLQRQKFTNDYLGQELRIENAAPALSGRFKIVRILEEDEVVNGVTFRPPHSVEIVPITRG
jgi:hypothetical protein